jgi:hypothetical protein
MPRSPRGEKRPANVNTRAVMIARMCRVLAGFDP